ncbi:MAG: GNAT family N-acetyltransferase [Clostridia bacterium]
MTEMFETKDLIIKKGKIEDAYNMHKNFWSQEESAKYMLWTVTKTVEDSKTKLSRWLEWQKEHTQWLIYEKSTGEAIGFVGFDEIGENKFGNIGLGIGSSYVGKGYGTQVMNVILDYIKSLGAREVEYSHLSGNIPSQKLAEKLGFKYMRKEKRVREWDKQEFDELFYTLNF